MYGLKNVSHEPSAVFYLWRMLKNTVYSDDPRYEGDLKSSIQSDKLWYDVLIFNYIVYIVLI